MKKKKTIKNILAHTVLTLLAIVWVSPLVWIILTSFRAQKGAYTSSFFPKSYSLDNYIKLFTDTGILNFPRMFTNTLIVAVFSCIISTFFVLSVAYCMSRLKFKMRKAMMNVAWFISGIYGNDSCVLHIKGYRFVRGKYDKSGIGACVFGFGWYSVLYCQRLL